ncbi:MAG: winged helix-turn-helix transcriptional regulator [Candidatus Thermoplasmatota archaeon]
MPGYTAAPPAEDVEYHLAHRFLGQDNPLDRGILEGLVGRPRRYGELKPLLQGKRDHNLTMALDRLRRDGLVDQRIDASTKPPTKSYELTNLGVHVVLRMHEMLPARVSAETLLRGQAAAT